MRRPSLARSYAFRTAIASGAIFVAATVILLLLVFRTATDTMTQQTLTAVQAQAIALGQAIDEGEQQEAVKQWRGVDREGIIRYAIDRRGQMIIADIRPRRRTVGPIILDPAQARSAFVDADRLDDSGLIGFGYRTPEGGYVLVGQDGEKLAELREALVRTLLFGTLVSILLSVAWGTFVAAQLYNRVEALNRVARRVMAGEMNQRMPVTRRGDEIDALAVDLNRMLNQLEKVMGAIRQVSADIAHDLRSPLTRLQSKLELLKDSENAQEREMHIASALAEARNMLDIFASLLRISQLEAGVGQSLFNEVDFSKLTGEVVEVFEPVFADNRRSLEPAIEPHIHFSGDRALLRQMIANILENVIAHTPEGTHATLSLRRQGSLGWAMTLCDNGPGIPPEHRERVFARFYRVDQSRTGAGSGLGLALAKAIADAHGLEIAIADQGAGVCVSIRQADASP